MDTSWDFSAILKKTFASLLTDERNNPKEKSSLGLYNVLTVAGLSACHYLTVFPSSTTGITFGTM